MNGGRRQVPAWPVLLALVATGCYEWVRVPPSELARLDQLPPNGTAVVRGENGKDIEVVGDFAVNVTTATASVDFIGPLHCSMKDGALQLAQTDERPQSFLLTGIKSTEVYHYDRPLTEIVVVLGTVAALAAVGLAGYAIVHRGPSVK